MRTTEISKNSTTLLSIVHICDNCSFLWIGEILKNKKTKMLIFFKQQRVFILIVSKQSQNNNFILIKNPKNNNIILVTY